MNEHQKSCQWNDSWAANTVVLADENMNWSELVFCVCFQLPFLVSLIAQFIQGFSDSSVGRICLQCRRPRFNSWVRKIPWRRDRLPTPVFLGFPCGSAGKARGTCCSKMPLWREINKLEFYFLMVINSRQDSFTRTGTNRFNALGSTWVTIFCCLIFLAVILERWWY